MLNQFDINMLKHTSNLNDVASVLNRRDLRIEYLVRENVKVKIAMQSLSASQATLSDVKTDADRFRLAAYYSDESFARAVNSVFHEHMRSAGFISNYHESDVLTMLKPLTHAVDDIYYSNCPGVDEARDNISNLIDALMPDLICMANDAAESEYCIKLDRACERARDLLAELR